MSRRDDLKLGLSPAQIEKRKGYIGGSDAGTIMSGDPDALIALWKEKRGEIPGKSLGHILPVVMGQHTEALNLCWYEEQAGRVVWGEGEHVVSKAYPHMAYTRDGLTTAGPGSQAVFQAKHVNCHSNMPDVMARYMPQLHHEMVVEGVRWAVLSVFIGTQQYEWRDIEIDDFYAAMLIDAERAFWKHVMDGTPPAAIPVAPPPIPPEKWRTIDMTGNNAWTHFAAEWLAGRDTAKAFSLAEKELKALVELDVGRAFGAGIQVLRKKNGLTIKTA